MAEEDNKDEDVTISSGYPVFQLAKSLRTADEHRDSETKTRALKKANKWLQAFAGMLSGSLEVGSRTPIKDTPVWATPEVLTGGFVSGNLLANGKLQKHEKELLAHLETFPGVPERALLNGSFLTEEGIASLQETLSEGNYDVSVPEEGALLVIAWLLSKGLNAEARSLLDEIAPYFPSLRFYPAPRDDAPRLSSRVFLEDIASVLSSIKNVRPSQEILAQKEAIEGWIPLYDRAISLLLELIDGETPSINLDGTVSGGLPASSASVSWKSRAADLLSEYEQFRKNNSRCKRPESKKHSFYQVRHFIKKYLDKQAVITSKDIKRVRVLLARYVTKRGAPGSKKWEEQRERQRQQASGPTYDLLSKALVSRLSALPKDQGLENLKDIVKPVTAQEAAQLKVETNAIIPAYFVKKIKRAVSDTVENLVSMGVITSGDTLAILLPQITASVHVLSFEEAELKRLYTNLYKAFRKRRSLLLLNLESQVKFEELPWVNALNRFRTEDNGPDKIAKESFRQAAELAFTSFPQAILPNKLLQEFRALAEQASIEVPLVDELAADIFMGRFSEKFVSAAKIAARLLGGSLYERYYNIDFEEISAIDDLTKSKYGPATSAQFASICEKRIPKEKEVSRVVRSAMIIEQQQILTTQNLAAIFYAANLAQCLQDRLPEMSRSCLQFVCSKQQMKINDQHARLTMIKNTAYAWRQMVFYLSLVSPSIRQDFFSWGNDLLSKQSQELKEHFRPLFEQLISADKPSSRRTVNSVDYFYGWGFEHDLYK
jgi:hypothetical protein